MSEHADHDTFHELQRELFDLRDALLASDVAAVERHTQTVNELLTYLRSPLGQQSSPASEADRRLLHHAARHALTSLGKAWATVRALQAVYRFFGSSEPDVASETL